MIKSMTAFARCEANESMGTLTWEIRAVNQRYLDINMRLPDEFRAMEGRYRELINASLSRGKLECGLRFRAEGNISSSVEINNEFALSVIHACESLNSRFHQSSVINVVDVLNWPGVVKESSQDMKPLMEASEALLKQALKELVENREREGERMKLLIEQRCDAVEEHIGNVRTVMPEIQQNQRQKILARFEVLNSEVDKDRIEQELVFLVQKMDVEEELDRLDSHIKELRDTLKRDEAVGRKLDFMMQEFNREANTLGSKSADIRTTQASVELKVLIEQMREQIQNIE